jgi:redox-sensitive bicupin YhaK (pirin superfamily)
MKEDSVPDSSLVLGQFPLDFQWPTQEPFLFCVHHKDLYPQGNGKYGPARELLVGRDLGQDFKVKDGFRMYHGEEVPGFPVHPHRGFETITIVRQGYVDHADSMGAAGRYGEGDVQWMTAGGGVQHSEMFPLLKTDSENHAELFQIWLNLPARSKMVKPAFKMFWSEKIPKVQLEQGAGEVTVIAGEFSGRKAITPPPDSWASNPNSEALILLVKLNPGAEFELPPSNEDVSRSVYFFAGKKVSINGTELSGQTGVSLKSRAPTQITASDGAIEILVLQAKPIGEPVVQYGPFVMNTKAEISQTMQDYQRTQFGGWSWGRHDMVHGPKIERFAKYPDGHIEKPV